jgi:hypothetical protein
MGIWKARKLIEVPMGSDSPNSVIARFDELRSIAPPNWYASNEAKIAELRMFMEEVAAAASRLEQCCGSVIATIESVVNGPKNRRAHVQTQCNDSELLNRVILGVEKFLANGDISGLRSEIDAVRYIRRG